MSPDDVLSEFTASGALLEGHFKLSSGRHSGYYLQCARVLMDPARAARIAHALVEKLPQHLRDTVDCIMSPAMGGIIIGHEVARAMGKNAMFLERPQGSFELRRGFSVVPGARVLMVEDVVTTGLSSRQAMEAVRASGADVVALASIVDRTGGDRTFDVPYHALVTFDFPTYADDALPADLAALPVTKPGSRA
ncbi:MAG: orotate phosphoribosyltransferase [Pontixanthobacter sp.]